ncbi:hypothetical protein AYO47_03545 [Planctomyces sp. SCGC AG-212-M04]|nr:hypothetical protein AYO47_03545 [Planctomyces sp. SCGC AG-212-M04]
MLQELVSDLRRVVAEATGPLKAEAQASLNDLLSKPLIRRALPAKDAWPISSEMRTSVTASLVELVGSDAHPLARIAAAKALLAADTLNSKRESSHGIEDEIPTVYLTQAEVESMQAEADSMIDSMRGLNEAVDDDEDDEHGDD